MISTFLRCEKWIEKKEKEKGNLNLIVWEIEKKRECCEWFKN